MMVVAVGASGGYDSWVVRLYPDVDKDRMRPVDCILRS